MALVDVHCQGPGPHDPPDGIVARLPEEQLATVTGARCASPYCRTVPDVEPAVPPPAPEEFTRFDNRRTLEGQARAAYAGNRALLTDAQVDAYLNAASPAPADTVKAVKLLLREARRAAQQRNGIMRLLLHDLDATD